ncbi:alpha/beta hydrolase [Microbacterium elymi]|uniref:Alpha/beta hydrolase n=1 Tax=Microbacterium elymi TaxID=2909587 RepID=A0ABY5NLT8_9MICO|nr:alpha/beta hydrolase [Microbacterium elymi]UUT36156.1 alpha/beta hydrolase [Microbacterium elymi]
MMHTPVRIHDIALNGGGYDFRVRVYPAEVPTGAMLVWLHGGGFMFGTVEMPEADQVGRRLSALGTTVVSVDYTLAPLDALASLPPLRRRPGCRRPSRWPPRLGGGPPCSPSRRLVADGRGVRLGGRERGALRRGAGPGGDWRGSAGGNLAAGAAMRLRDRAADDPDAVVPSVVGLVYPVLHAPLPPADAELEGLLTGLPAALTFPPEATQAINANYLGDTPSDRYAFPGGHDLTGYPRTLVVTADRDRLRPSGEAFAAELARAGVDVRIERQRGAMHGYLNEIGDPAAERTLALLAAAVHPTGFDESLPLG